MSRPLPSLPALLSPLSASSPASSSPVSLSSPLLSSSVSRCLLSALLWLWLCWSCECAPLTFAPRDAVPVLVNNVGPFHNPAESYKFYSLPYCEASPNAPPLSDDDNLGEILAGDRRRPSPYEVRFSVSEEHRALCEKQLTAEEVDLFVSAIRRHSVFELFVDDLAVKGLPTQPTTHRTPQPSLVPLPFHSLPSELTPASAVSFPAVQSVGSASPSAPLPSSAALLPHSALHPHVSFADALCSVLVWLCSVAV